MGLMLMQFEYQKAKADQTMYQLRGISLNNKQKLYQTRMGKINELFAKKGTQLESRFNRMNSQASMKLSQLASGGASMLINGGASIFTGLLGGVITTAVITAAINSATGDIEKNADATVIQQQNAKATAASQVASQLQMLLQTLIEQAKEAAEQALEMEKEEMLEPVAEKDVEMEMKIATNDTLLTLAETRAEKAKAKLGQYAKDSVAGFGIS